MPPWTYAPAWRVPCVTTADTGKRSAGLEQRRGTPMRATSACPAPPSDMSSLRPVRAAGPSRRLPEAEAACMRQSDVARSAPRYSRARNLRQIKAAVASPPPCGAGRRRAGHAPDQGRRAASRRRAPALPASFAPAARAPAWLRLAGMPGMPGGEPAGGRRICKPPRRGAQSPARIACERAPPL